MILPIDTAQLLKVFQTVDIKDVIKWTASGIEMWESKTKCEPFIQLDHTRQT
jgi:hypothetical protein